MNVARPGIRFVVTFAVLLLMAASAALSAPQDAPGDLRALGSVPTVVIGEAAAGLPFCFVLASGQAVTLVVPDDVSPEGEGEARQVHFTGVSVPESGAGSPSIGSLAAAVFLASDGSSGPGWGVQGGSPARPSVAALVTFFGDSITVARERGDPVERTVRGSRLFDQRRHGEDAEFLCGNQESLYILRIRRRVGRGTLDATFTALPVLDARHLIAAAFVTGSPNRVLLLDAQSAPTGEHGGLVRMGELRVEGDTSEVIDSEMLQLAAPDAKVGHVTRAFRGADLAAARTSEGLTVAALGCPNWGGERGRVEVLRRATDGGTWTVDYPLTADMLLGSDPLIPAVQLGSSVEVAFSASGQPIVYALAPENAPISLLVAFEPGTTDPSWVVRWPLRGTENGRMIRLGVRGGQPAIALSRSVKARFQRSPGVLQSTSRPALYWNRVTGAALR